MSEVVLVVVAHPDDETLGMGGTIARLVEEGCDVRVVRATDGVGARSDEDESVDAVASQCRLEEWGKACRVLGVGNLGWIGRPLPDNALDTVPLLRVVQRLEDLVEKVKPSTVYTHHPGDLNIDHQLIARAVITAARPYPGQVVKHIYGFEVPGSTEWAAPGAVPFVPTRFVPLTVEHVHTKLRALGCYASEFRDVPHPRFPSTVKALAEVRGSQCGHEYAEAFTVIREVV